MSELQDIRVELATMLAKVDDATVITTEEMGQVQDHLGQLWEQTENVAGAHELISQTWEHVQAIAEQNAALTFQVVASGNISQAALAETKIEREARQDLEDAIDAEDEDHPRLRDFAESIRDAAREDFEEYMADDIWPEAMAEAFEEIRDEVNNKIENLTGCGWKAASAFLSIIMGRRAQFTPLQAEMFTELLMTFVSQIEAEEAASGH